MSSPARIRFEGALARARTLRVGAAGQRRPERQTFYHASLAASVAAWQTYIMDLIDDFFDATMDVTASKYTALHLLGRANADGAKKRFNTPSWENARSLLVEHTGYDPLADWAWPRRGKPSAWVKERLNQILKVRHSFAHGHAMPVLPWTQDSNGRARLTKAALSDTDAFLVNLVRCSDRGMKDHLSHVYHVRPLW